jgi:protein phosphatase methylesterase 1
MGGAVVVNAVPRLLEAKYRVSGVVVLDVVEGTAIDALPHMPSVLNSRPEGFDSVSDAIEWQYDISLPSLRTVRLRTTQHHREPDS